MIWGGCPLLYSDCVRKRNTVIILICILVMSISQAGHYVFLFFQQYLSRLGESWVQLKTVSQNRTKYIATNQTKQMPKRKYFWALFYKSFVLDIFSGKWFSVTTFCYFKLISHYIKNVPARLYSKSFLLFFKTSHWLLVSSVSPSLDPFFEKLVSGGIRTQTFSSSAASVKLLLINLLI